MNMKKTSFLIISLLVLASCKFSSNNKTAEVNTGKSETTTRNIKEISITGSGYEAGLQHGKLLKTEIASIIEKWKANIEISLGKNADSVLKEFFAYANFTEAIKKWTPDLYEEVKGIADGAVQPFNDVMILNLLDEFWVFIDDIKNHHCSGLGVPAKNGNPGYISQNMDLENYTDGFQVLMRLSGTENSPEQLILTYPGLIALNGINESGIGVCVNTLMQLKASAKGLPVAFVIRRILNSENKDDLLQFIQKVNHASGQNYIIGIKGEVFDFEASANNVIRFDPKNKNGTVYHTNHPVINNDIKPWFKAFDPDADEKLKPLNSNSYLRFAAVEKRMKKHDTITDSLIKETLRSRDNKNNPVCRTNNNNGFGFTFASTIMTFEKNPYIDIAAGPPDEYEYKRYYFSKK